MRVIALDNPPVNALSFAYCAKLIAQLEAAHADNAVEAIVFTGRNGLFSAGADVNDFKNELPAGAVTIRDVIHAVETSGKLHIAAIDGNCLGGGLELALACDYRIATARSKLGLPEIRLGLLPGAGGTQRLPRLIGARAALEFMLKGSSANAERALELGILDEVVEGDVVEHAVAKARSHPPKRRISAMQSTIAPGISDQAGPYVVAQAHKMVPPENRGGLAAHKLIDAVHAAVELPFAFGLAREARLFDELVRSEPSLALRHVFFAERELTKVDGVTTGSAQDDMGGGAVVKLAGVVGAGTMGSGIAIAFAQSGIPVVVVDNSDEAVDRARQTVMGMFMYQVQKGRLTQEEAWKRAQSIRSPTIGTDSPTPTSSSRPSSRTSTSRTTSSAASMRSQTRRDLGHQHVDARRRPDRGDDEASRRTCSGCTFSSRRTSCRCSRSCAGGRRRRDLATAFRLGKRCARRPCSPATRSASSATAWSSITCRKRPRSPKRA